MGTRLEIEKGREIVVPDAFKAFDPKVDFPALESIRLVRSVEGQVQFVFDPENEEYLELLEESRERTKGFNSALRKAFDGLPVAVRKDIRPSKHVIRVSFMIRPVVGTTPALVSMNNSIDLNGQSSVICLHIDEEGGLHGLRLVFDKEKISLAQRSLLKSVLLDLKKIALNFDGKPENFDSVAIQFAEVFRNKMKGFLALPKPKNLEVVKKYASDVFVLGDAFYWVAQYVEAKFGFVKRLPSDLVDAEVSKILTEFPGLNRDDVRNLFFRRSR